MSAFERGRAPADIGKWLASPAGRLRNSVDDVVIDGVRCIVKRRQPGLRHGLSYVARYVRACLLAVGCKVFLGEFPRPGVLLRNDLAYESERLDYLLAKSVKVPTVWWRQSGLLVLEHVGDEFVVALRHAGGQQRIALIESAATDLAVFHRRGLWHGGAQLRNLVLRDGEIWRIDFEENIGEALSLPLAQAYDVYQMLSSLMGLRRVDPGQLPELGQRLLATYFEQNPSDAVKAQSIRLAKVVCACATLMSPVRRWAGGRDIQGFFRVADTLRLLLHP